MKKRNEIVYTFLYVTLGVCSVLSQDFKGPQFNAFVERIENAESSQRSAIVDSFMQAQSAFPVIEQDTVVYFLYRGSAGSMSVPGDFNGWNSAGNQMILLAGTNLWYNEDVFESDARLDYKFVRNGSSWILDPRNDNTVSGGFGPNSELAMPAYVQPPEIEYYADIPHGSLQSFSFSSSALGNSRTINVYLPPGYSEAVTDTFPVILFHDGGEYLQLADADNTLDYLIARGKIEPVVAVFVPPVQRNDEYAGSKVGKFTTFIIDELMPHIEENYRVSLDPSKRAMTGPSYGGRITTTICYAHPEEFGLAAPVSGSIYADVDDSPVTTGQKKELRWYLDWGTYEGPQRHRETRDALIEIGYELEWNEWHEGHSWGSWRAHLDNILEYFFPAAVSAIADGSVETPRGFALLQNYPNPFNPSTTIVYELPWAADVRVEIFNSLGQRVNLLVDGRQNAGRQQLVWDGRDDHGTSLAGGIYFYRLQSQGFSQTRKMLLIK